MGVLSKTRSMALTTTLGDDALLLERFSYSDELGRLYRMTVDATAGKDAVTIESAIGKPATLRVRKSDGEQRYFNGIVSKVTQNGVAAKVTSKTGRQKIPRYQLTIVPSAWMLTRHSDCRIFQNETIPDIIKKVFAARGIGGFLDTKLRGTYKPHDYIVQYRETDFNFVSRLMEFEGIYYHFAHENGSHKLVLADGPSSHAKLAGYSTIPFYPHQAVNKHDRIMSWHLETEVQSGQIALQSYDFKNPSQPHNEIKKVDFSHLLKTEVFDYPVEFHKPKDAATYAKLRAEELAARAEMAVAETDCRGVCCGGTFKLSDPTQELRKQECKEYLVAGVDVHGTAPDHGAMLGRGSRAAEEWTCSFRAVPARRQFRPARITPKPIISGPQTAVVVGSQPSEEILTDKFGRVKVHFHWDRHNPETDKASCWIRVNQPFAGKGWGGVQIPRVGTEVIVEFLEGDPDRPIITGRVYNAGTMPPVSGAGRDTSKGETNPSDMVQAAMQMTLRSNSLGGSGGHNEITMHDSGGEEKLFLRAEKDEVHLVQNDRKDTVGHDETRDVGHDRKKHIGHDETTSVDHDRTETVGNNETITIGVDRTEDVGSNEKITIGANRTESVGADEKITIGSNRTEDVGADESITIGANRTEKVGADETVTIDGKRTHSIGSDDSLSVSGDQTISISGGQTISVSKDQSLTVSGGRTTSISKADALTVGKALTISAADAITLKTGDASITMKKDGTITIKGKDITIQGSGKMNIKADGKITMKGEKILQN